jgi:hypothetical protein
MRFLRNTTKISKRERARNEATRRIWNKIFTEKIPGWFG